MTTNKSISTSTFFLQNFTQEFVELSILKSKMQGFFLNRL
jgi:hypothetical protein